MQSGPSIITLQAMLSHRDEKAAFRAAQIAQERMICYMQDVSADVVEADRDKAEQLAHRCENTFKEWMASCGEFTVH